MTSLKRSSNAESRHSSGKRLFEFSDYVTNNRMSPGDAILEIGDDIPKAARISIIIHCLIIQTIVAEVATRLYNAGVRPPFFISYTAWLCLNAWGN